MIIIASACAYTAVLLGLEVDVMQGNAELGKVQVANCLAFMHVSLVIGLDARMCKKQVIS